MAQVNAVGVYDWKPIYQELATKLLRYQGDRAPLLAFLREHATTIRAFSTIVEDRFADGRRAFPEDICPMTLFASFNRGIRDAWRVEGVGALARFLQTTAPIPTRFDGIPRAHNQKTWFYPFAASRGPKHIGLLWELWARAVELADSDQSSQRASFLQAFDEAFGLPYSSWGVTSALFWARPDYFVPLDGRSRSLLEAAGFEVGKDGEKGRVSAANYLELCDAVRKAIAAKTVPWGSIAEMSYGAFVVDARDGGEDSEIEDEEVVTLSGGGRVWLVAAGAGGKQWETWKERGIVSISVEDIDLSDFESKADIRDALADLRDGPKSPVHDAMACWDFLKVMVPGDEIFVKSGRSTLLGHGRVTGGYRFEPRDGYCHERDAAWDSSVAARIPEGADLLVTKALTNITRYRELVSMLRCLVAVPAPPEPSRTFLFTWNPERWEWPELEASAAALARGEELPADQWNTGGRQDLREGDRFFLLRQGTAPRGIIGSGHVLGPPVEQAHWEEARAAAGDTTRSAPIAYDRLLPRDRALTIETLKAAGLEAVRWNPQSSGTQIPPQFVAQVEAAWQAHLEGRTVPAAIAERAVEPYDLDDLEAEGCFVPRARVEAIIGRLRSKKNLILQGPPGTGKTWLAKRLGDLLVGHRHSGRVRVVQFHPNVSYEDFVRGYRPGSDGKLRIVNGLFMEAVKAAKARPELPMVVVIEEINRGNPAQVFGELLTLLEASKRNAESAIELTYAGPDEGQGELRQAVHLPENLFVIGTMNTADRSIAMVDIAFRRRFTFENLRPALDEAWLAFVERHGVSRALANQVRNAVESLNDAIRSAKMLGPDYCLGHSFFTPHDRLEDGAAQAWFDGVVEAEISPLIYEYWFDDPESAKRAVAALREALR